MKLTKDTLQFHKIKNPRLILWKTTFKNNLSIYLSFEVKSNAWWIHYFYTDLRELVSLKSIEYEIPTDKEKINFLQELSQAKAKKQAPDSLVPSIILDMKKKEEEKIFSRTDKIFLNKFWNRNYNYIIENGYTWRTTF